MSISHSMIDFLPSMFLGVPDRGNGSIHFTRPLSHASGKGKRSHKTGYIRRFWFVDCNNYSYCHIFALLLPPIYVSIKPYIYLILILAVIVHDLTLNKDRYLIALVNISFYFFRNNGLGNVKHTNIHQCFSSYHVFRAFWG